MRLAGLNCRRRNLGDEAEKFMVYLRNNFEPPRHRYDRTHGITTLDAPFEFRLLTTMMTEFHMTIDAAMDTSIAMANALWVTHAEINGSVALQSDLDRALLGSMTTDN